ncbi:MAG: TraR/DksA family transcriptional regulator [Patescibacteria group bacterium]
MHKSQSPLNPNDAIRERLISQQRELLLEQKEHRESLQPEEMLDFDDARGPERRLAISRLDQTSAELRDVSAALLRLRAGTYGVCDECEGSIPPKRLKAWPHARYCLDCQAAADRSASGEPIQVVYDLFARPSSA